MISSNIIFNFIIFCDIFSFFNCITSISSNKVSVTSNKNLSMSNLSALLFKLLKPLGRFLKFVNI